MDWGMQNRLAQLIQADGRCLFVPVDHGYFQGPIKKLENPRKTLEPLLPYADAIFITRGALRSCVDPDKTKPIILRVSGGIFVGTDHEHDSLLNLAKLVDEGERYGMPVMAVTAVGRELEKRDDRYLALSCRIAAELGARVVKTYYCEKFEKVTGGCPVPVVIAGGPKVATGYEVLQFVHDGIRKGAIGVNLGRNIWQDEHPVAMIRAIRAIIHENATPERAQKLYDSVKSGKR
jgi:putative autoinducer-2 (AI-2) aldolase